MSLGARATKGGAKGKEGKTQDKGKTEKPQPKEKVKPQATTEQLRMAHMIDRKNEDASDVRRMVLELMEMTCRTEEEVCSALHDSDNDLVAACELLLEDTQRIQGEWQTNEKKKKKPPAAAGNGEAEPPRDHDPRSRSGPRPRRGEGEGARGRGGALRGRGAGRGGARAARLPRRAPARGRRPPPRPGHMDNDTGGTGGDSFPAPEDWDNEEWSGSLSDTKVFTPSTSANAASDGDPAVATVQEDWETPEANGGTEGHIPTYTYHNPALTQDAHAPHLNLMEPIPPAPLPHASPAPPADPYPPTTHHQPMGMSGSLSAAQSQYLSQLTAAARAADPAYHAPHTPHTPHAAHTPLAPHAAHSLPHQVHQQHQQQPQQQPAAYGYSAHGAEPAPRKPQRARVPPPSKIPSSAVEMPGGGEAAGAMFLDVQFGALEPDTLAPAPPAKQAEPAAPLSAHEPEPAPAPAYAATNAMLNESLSSVVEPTPPSQPVTTESIVTNSTTSLEKQLTAGMKQLGVSAATEPASTQPPAHHHYTQHHRPKQTVSQQQNVYAHHAVSHHPPVYGANVYAPQVNSTNASLTAATGMAATAYPSSVTLTQYQPMINSYQQTSSSATVYGGSALYTAAPYQPTAYQPTPQPKQKDTTQYDSSVASSNSLTSTSTTQATTAKVATTAAVTAGGSTPGAGAGAGYAAGALYGSAATYAYDDQLMRTTLPHHMGGYYEVGYGAREGTFGLGAGERFGRADAASPQQVPAAALPPGYAYFYQPPPTTYQYGVYPTYGGGSNVGGVGGVGGVSGGGAGKLNTYAPQQPPYDAQDTYKPGGPYTGNANKSAGGAANDLTSAMYAKTHVALNKVNSYEKAAFHSGTPPPFGAASHLYIPAPPHHHPHHHAPQPHQMDARVNSSHNRRESGAGGGRAAAAKPAASKPTYSQSYWAPN